MSALVPAKTSWICPNDDRPCDMTCCNGGNTCDIAKYSYGSGHTVYSSGGGYKAAPPCHYGMKSLGFINKAELMIGKESSAKAWDQTKDGKVGLVLGLLGDAYPQGNLVSMNEQAKTLGGSSLNVLTPVIPNIWIRWPDYGIVPFDRAWWDGLIDVVAGVDGAVLLYCMGGHGRSGTAACIIGSITGLCPEGDDPVAWLRKVYCEKVVESKAQIEYIEKITGRKVSVAVSKDFNYSTWKASGKGESKKKVGGKNCGKTKKAVSDPNVLSKRKWKRWWRRQPKTGKYCGIASVERPTNLPDGQQFTIGSRTWAWSKERGAFELVQID